MERFLFFPISCLSASSTFSVGSESWRLKFNANQYLSVPEYDFYCCVFIAIYIQPQCLVAKATAEVQCVIFYLLDQFVSSQMGWSN